MNTEIYHCVFTHATDGWSGSGGRFIAVDRDAAQILPTEALIELKAFLGKLMPESKAPAWSMRRFAAGSERYACVIASYGGFADADGRDGVLNHARVVQLERDSLWFDPFPLVAMAEDFDIDSVREREPVDRLQAYLDRIAEEDVVTVIPLSREELKTLPRDLVRDVLTGTLAAIADTRGRRRVRAPQGRLAQIARAWAALPVGLQRLSTWAYGANDGVPVQLIWSADLERTSVAAPSDAVIDCVAKYTGILLDSTYDIRQFVNDEEIDLAGFSKFVQVASATAAALPERPAMSKKSQKQESRPRSRVDSAIDDDSVLDLNRQYDRMFAAIKEYVDLRLDAYEAGGAMKVAARQALSSPPGATWKQRLDRNAVPIIGALIAGVLLTLGVLFAMGRLGGDNAGRGRAAVPARTATTTHESRVNPESATESQTETVDERPIASPRLRKLIDDAARTGKWKEAFLTLSETEPETVARMIDDTINAPTANSQTRSVLADLRDRVRGSGKKLNSNDREVLRKYLLQYIATREGTADDAVAVDEDLSDLRSELMKAIKTRTNVGSSSDKPDDFELQSEVILRWLEMNPS